MSEELKYGQGYIELGLAADAKAELKNVNGIDPQYDEARAEPLIRA